MNSWGLFFCAQIDLRNARERELATLDEKSTSSGIAEPYICAIKTEGKNRGGEGMAPVTTACPEAGKLDVCGEVKKTTDKVVRSTLNIILACGLVGWSEATSWAP